MIAREVTSPHGRDVGGVEVGPGLSAHCGGMTTMPEALPSSPNDDLFLRLATAAHLGRFTGTSRMHTESDLRLFFAWCAAQHLAPQAAQRAQIERYVRWMQEVRRFKPSTVSRRMAVVTGFYRTCVIDAVLKHSPADYVRRPVVPPESPTLGLSHLQFGALLTAARESANVFDFALVAMLGLLGLRIFEACGADIADMGEEHGHYVLRVWQGLEGRAGALAASGGAGDRSGHHRPQRWSDPAQPARGTDRHCATRRLRRLAQVSVVRLPRMHPHMLRHTLPPPCSTPRSLAPAPPIARQPRCEGPTGWPASLGSSRPYRNIS